MVKGEYGNREISYTASYLIIIVTKLSKNNYQQPKIISKHHAGHESILYTLSVPVESLNAIYAHPT